ncbi:hypothetical protein [Spiroplasma cantharicola]|uniref:Uncharacterized protein n=1 Tax=Spiroplasma cantharicola TaxID=362837 RepID=A0A0M3SJ88_9MOLU|nr:hypothetical protein [Spiroplasma cantharicola]ALD66328.1 hypothetical protein SCANT_v1c04220 [Spiroplasma cantharicola]
MNKLLGILSSISLLIAAVPVLVFEKNQITLEKNNNYLNSEYATINLDELNLKTGEVNLYAIRNKLDNEKKVTLKLLMDLSNSNKENKEFSLIIKSVAKNFEDWIVIIPELPLENKKTVGLFSLTYIWESNQFKGILMLDNLLLSNESVAVKLSLTSVIKETRINKIKKLTKENLESKILFQNLQYGLETRDFSIDTINYEYAIVTVTKESKYSWQVEITYESVLEDIVRVEANLARSDVYNSEQSDFKTSAVEIDIDLGKEKLLEKFKYIDYNLGANYYTQGMGRFEYIVNKNNPETIEYEYKDKSHLKPSYEIIELIENTTINVFELTYKNVNWEKDQGSLITTWLSDFKLEIRLNVNTWVWASAWNTTWARAEARLSLSDIKFS